MGLYGGFTLSSSLAFQVPAGGNVSAPYSVPVQPKSDIEYAPGSGPNQANAPYQQGGNATAAVVTIDLLTVVRVDGTAGFAHVREVVVYHQGSTAGQPLKFDTTVANSFLGNLETAAKIDIQAGAPHRMSRPIETAGWAITSANHLITLDPGAATIPYFVVILGD